MASAADASQPNPGRRPASASTLAATPVSLVFSNDPTSATLPPAQAVKVTAGTASVAFTASASVTTPVGSGWLAVSPSSGSTPGSLSVLVNPSGLPIGSYTGKVMVAALAAGAATQTVAVSLTVKAPPISLSVSPASLTFNYQVGTAAPVVQNLAVGSSGTFLSYTTSATSTGNWLRVTPPTGLVFAAFPATVAAVADPTGLFPGTYAGKITLAAAGASNPTQTINVSLVIAPGLPVLYSLFPVAVTQSAGATTLTVSGAGFFTGSAVKANIAGTDTVLTSVLLSANLMTAVVPATLLAAAATLAIRVSNGAAGDSTAINVPVLPPGPRIYSTGIVSAASLQGGSVAPGQIMTIFGAGIGPSSLTVTASGNLATTLANTQVMFGTTPAPLIYTQANQLSFIVPYSVVPGTPVALTVIYNSATSNAINLTVDFAVPGFFTLDDSGSGPAAAINQDGTINSATNAAQRGNVVVLYLTGEGQTNPAGIDGRIDAGPLGPVPLLPVTATIGGVPALVQYMGGAPGSVAGLCQLNLLIPTGVAPGIAVPISITLGSGNASFTSFIGPTIAVK